ncbi:hypothetical protein SLEP1_g24039 [Rubroshorea leprosula]|uniref:Uncharacterized protein n=1 Tax=Rubroshorea leprosula TaxID=152421 RepID=A0AAV5JKB2_9ROSI|nr:hypothetical protein SLEP1_g24039 [Rubroshorea leprosula]
MRESQVNTYLSIILKVGFEYIFNIGWLGGVDLIPERTDQPVGPILPGKISHIMVQSTEVEKLVEDCATHRMVLIFSPIFVQTSSEDLEGEDREDNSKTGEGDGAKIHGFPVDTPGLACLDGR